MAVERAFGMLKERWRILLKQIDMSLQNVPVIVEACICLHNLCIIHRNDFNKGRVRRAKNDILEESRREFGNLHRDSMNTLNIAKESIKQMKVVRLCTKDVVSLVE
jgi:hypothetical protein